MTVTIEGTIKTGHGGASDALEKQWPYLTTEVPEIAHCRRSTINVELDRGLLILNSDQVTQPIPWQPGALGERFRLLRIKLEFPIGTAGRDCWLYDPEFTPHGITDYLQEILAPPIGGIEPGKRCRIHIDKPQMDYVVI